MIWRVFAKEEKKLVKSYHHHMEHLIWQVFSEIEKNSSYHNITVHIEFNGTLWFDEFFLYFQVLIVVVLLALAALAEAQRNNGNRNNRNRGNNNRNNRNRGNNNQQTRNRNPVISGGFRATPANAKDRSGNEVYPGCDGTVCLPKANLCAQRKNKRMRFFLNSKNHNTVIAKSFDYI